MHAHGIWARWRSLTRDQSVAFVIAVSALAATLIFGLYPLLHNVSSVSDRAYVSFVGFGNAILNNSPTGQVWGYMFPLLWANTGLTPTVNGKMQVGHKLSDDDLPQGFEYPPDKTPIAFNVEPKLGGALDYDLPLNDLIAIQQHTSRYFIWGSFTYHDISPKNPMRLHEFCIEITHVMHYGQRLAA